MSDLYDYQDNEQAQAIIDNMSGPHRWVTLEDVDEVASIAQCGCASSAYMPAVTYSTAKEIMFKHGDEVLDFLDESCYMDEFNINLKESTWGHVCVQILSTAVEVLCLQIEDRILSEVEL